LWVEQAEYLSDLEGVFDSFEEDLSQLGSIDGVECLLEVYEEEVLARFGSPLRNAEVAQHRNNTLECAAPLPPTLLVRAYVEPEIVLDVLVDSLFHDPSWERVDDDHSGFSWLRDARVDF